MHCILGKNCGFFFSSRKMASWQSVRPMSILSVCLKFCRRESQRCFGPLSNLEIDGWNSSRARYEALGHKSYWHCFKRVKSAFLCYLLEILLSMSIQHEGPCCFYNTIVNMLQVEEYQGMLENSGLVGYAQEVLKETDQSCFVQTAKQLHVR